MPLVHLDSTPDFHLHRINARLRWEPQSGRALDGQVEMRVGVEGAVAMLLPQPYKPKRYSGVSFFLPQCDQRVFDAAHNLLARAAFPCVVSVPHTPLPEHLQLVNDHTFKIRLFGEQNRMLVGQHYTLFASEEMPVSVFEHRFTELLQDFQPCSMRAEATCAATLATLTDPHVMPTDGLSTAAVMALEDLASTTSDPDTALFATLFALDMRACDTDFEDVLEGCSNRAVLVAAALDHFVVRDAMLREHAYDAQEALEGALPGYKPRWCKFEPFWVHPFQFKGHYSDESYDTEVKVCAQGFQGDNVLKAKVSVLATDLFGQLASSVHQVDLREGSFEHVGVTFKVKCMKL